MTEIFKNQISVWQALKGSSEPVVLYGMGDGADKVLAAFEKYGITAAGVMASDGFVRGQQFHGFTVKRLSDFEKEYGDFTIALCFASQLPEVMATIKSAASRHRLLVPSVPAFGDVLFDDDFINAHLADMEAAYALLADEQSRAVFKNVLRFYHTGDISLLDAITTPKDEAFDDILKLGRAEIYVDLGAYNGDTVDEFLHYTRGEYREIIALEPNAKNFKKLQAHCEGMPRVRLLKLGAWSENTTLTFNNKAGRNSAVADSGVETPVAALDELLSGGATYIKADVEGADREALLGMRRTLNAYKPKLNFAAYHRFEDIFGLVLLIHELNPDYKLYLRHHPYIPAWDTNLYCV